MYIHILLHCYEFLVLTLACVAFQFVLVYRHVGPLTGENDVQDDTRFEMVALGMIQHVLILFRALPSRSYLPPL